VRTFFGFVAFGFAVGAGLDAAGFRTALRLFFVLFDFLLSASVLLLAEAVTTRFFVCFRLLEARLLLVLVLPAVDERSGFGLGAGRFDAT
jgi:hypothetical protein